MERLFLLSAGIDPSFQKRLKETLGTNRGKRRVVYASMIYPDGTNPFRKNEIWDWFNDHGYALEPITLDPAHSLEAQSRIKTADIFVFNGGDPFQLLKLVRETGVDKILIEKIREGYPYVGSSAAAMLVGPTIEPALFRPDADGNTTGNHNFAGLNLIPYIIWPHYRDDHYQSVQKLSATFPYPCIAIRDYQAVVHENGKSEIVGEPPRFSYWEEICQP